MIVEISNNYSTGVSNEIIATTEFEKRYTAMLNESSSAEDYVNNKSSASLGAKEYSHLLKKIPNKKLRVLDIGVGGGQSTIYLAHLGHEVSCIEPSPTFCNIIEKAADKFALDITIYRGVAENMNNINNHDFDLVLFNASFHHCDSPKLVLDLSYNLLKPGGKIVLASENFLRVWNSKKHWHYLLENHPDKIGHYGGNEHIYFNWEYYKLLENSQFKNIELLPTAFTRSPVEHLQHVINLNVIRGEMAILIRYVYYIAVSSIFKSKFLFERLSKLSIIQCNFMATK